MSTIESTSIETSTQSVAGIIASERTKRRTFAIISHPDAGKTTLTEKLLLYSGMVHTAGMVRGRKGTKAASSDWMAMEQERGISITASAMQFSYKDTVINLLDTPGHQDFSEDTYRTLTAADSAVMIIDAGNGVEAQTKKLFAVCRMQRIPILTFINKLDLASRDPFDLMQEVEQVLGIHASPLNWPIGSGRNFLGVADIRKQEVFLFQRSAEGGSQRAQSEKLTIDEFLAREQIDLDLRNKLKEDLELLEVAGNVFSDQAFLNGEVTPVLFGSALTNFGVEPFFDTFVELAPAPRAYNAKRISDGTEIKVDPDTTQMSGFVFKIQANMNPKHRDSMAFLRVCSGRLQRDMTVVHQRTNKTVRLSRSYSMVARDRSTIDYAYPGDIVGMINPGVFAIGDTISESKCDYAFPQMPSFPPECVGQIRPVDVMKRKAFEKGIKQLCDEGAVQLLRSYENREGPPYVAAVGKLQFDVLQYRIREEYGVETILELLPYKISAWLIGDVRTLKPPSSSFIALDIQGRVVILFSNEWEKNYLLEKNPQHKLEDFVA